MTTFEKAVTAGMERVGKFNHSGAKTLTPNVLQNISADYEFLDNGYILIVKNYMTYCKEIIETAEKSDKWFEATLADSPDHIYRDTTMRSSKNLLISGTTDPMWKGIDEVLADSFHNCVKLYLFRNKFAKITSDTGYEMLKYGVGGQFDEHVDVIPNHPQWGYRRVSGLAYLNDDYEGGELVFPRREITIKPEAGSLVFFPSDFSYSHASMPIKTGTKYAVVTWFT